MRWGLLALVWVTGHSLHWDSLTQSSFIMQKSPTSSKVLEYPHFCCWCGGCGVI